MKETMIYHKVRGVWIRYSTKEVHDYMEVTAKTGYKTVPPPSYPGARVPELQFVEDNERPVVQAMDKEFIVSLARFYLRSAQPKNPPKYPWQGPL